MFPGKIMPTKPSTPERQTSEAQPARRQRVGSADIWLTDTRKKTLGSAALALVACVVLLLFWVMHEAPVPAADMHTERADLDISSRVVVPALKPIPEDNALSTGNASEEQADDGYSRADAIALEEARMKSAIMVQDASLETTADGGIPTADVLADAGRNDVNSRFAKSVSGQGVPNSVAQPILSLEYKVLQGKMIEAVLESRTSSDLPGMVCATVQRDVYGAQKRVKLIPWGARVCGQYSAELRTGQERLFVVWNTLRRPDGVEVALDSVGADQLGTAGMGGLVDTHFARIFGVSSLLSIIGIGSASSKSSSYTAGNRGSDYRDAVQMAASNTAQQLLQPYVNIQPTITVPAGARIRIYVNRDLDFSHVYQAQDNTAMPDDVMIVG